MSNTTNNAADTNTLTKAVELIVSFDERIKNVHSAAERTFLRSGFIDGVAAAFGVDSEELRLAVRRST